MGIIEKVPAYVEKLPGGGVVISSVEDMLNASRAHSLWYLLFGLACCAIEMMATGAARYDLDRLGMFFRASPRQADLMMVCGTVTHKMGKRVKILYDQMSDPKYVLAMGGCASNGGPFYYDSYSVLKGIDRVIPVDVYIPGCPPRPESLLEGTLKIREVVKKQKIKDFLGDKPMQS